MSRRLLRMIALMTVLLCLVPAIGEAPLPGTPAAFKLRSAPIAAPSVQLHHELITVASVSARPRPAAREARFRRAVANPNRAADRSVGTRARRLILGDGTYRPEPFPRLTRD